MKGKDKGKLITIQVTQGDIQDATKHRIHKSKKDYNRTKKHKKDKSDE